MTQVHQIRVIPVRVPLAKPMAATGKLFRYRDYLLVELTCADESIGIGFSYVGTGGGRAAVLATEELLVPEVIGADPTSVETIWERLYRATLIQGRAGLVMNGLSAIDIALWDRNARQAGMPLYQFLGATPNQPSVPAYASGGYYADDKGLDELREEIVRYQTLGFNAVKIKTGRLSVREEEQRVKVVREVIGRDGRLLLDLYNAWTGLAEAMPYINMYQQYDPYWIEDPFMPEDLENFARLAQKISVPIATGEFHYTRFSFKQMIDRAGVSIIQPEAPRCGGITEWRRIAMLASASGVGVSPCWFHQIHAHLLPICSSGLFVECFPDDSILNFNRLIDATWNIRDGAIQLPAKPGLGFNFVPDAIAEFRLT